MFTGLSRVYPLIGLLCGYVIVLLFNPVRVPLRDGFRCLLRYKRVWLTFVLLGFAYFVFQFCSHIQHIIYQLLEILKIF